MWLMDVMSNIGIPIENLMTLLLLTVSYAMQPLISMHFFLKKIKIAAPHYNSFHLTIIVKFVCMMTVNRSIQILFLFLYPQPHPSGICQGMVRTRQAEQAGDLYTKNSQHFATWAKFVISFIFIS
jgi:hypothetical protein